MLFEGEYLNGVKWIGKFEEYYGGKLVLEGEYINGKIWNRKGKHYDSNGCLNLKENILMD